MLNILSVSTRYASLYILSILLPFCNTLFSAARDNRLPFQMSEVSPNARLRDLLGRFEHFEALEKECGCRQIEWCICDRLKREDPCYGLDFLQEGIKLLKLGADPNLTETVHDDIDIMKFSRGPRTYSLLSIAITNDDYYNVKLLLESYKTDPNQSTAVKPALLSPNPAMVALLLDAGMKLEDPLHWCFERFKYNMKQFLNTYDDSLVTELLIKRGFSVNEINKRGRTPLTQLAIDSAPMLFRYPVDYPNASQYFELFVRRTARLLLAAGADTESVVGIPPRDDHIFIADRRIEQECIGLKALEIVQNILPLCKTDACPERYRIYHDCYSRKAFIETLQASGDETKERAITDALALQARNYVPIPNISQDISEVAFPAHSDEDDDSSDDSYDEEYDSEEE